MMRNWFSKRRAVSPVRWICLGLLAAGFFAGCGDAEPQDELVDIGATLTFNDEDEVVAVKFPKTGTDEDLEQLLEFKRLRVLDLSGSQVTDEGMDTVAELSSLQELKLGGTEVSDDGVLKLTELERLSVLTLTQPPEPEKPKEVAWTDAITLGIDLAGGTNLVYAVDRNEAERMDKRITPQLMEQMVGAVAKRLDPSGTKELTVRQVGVDRIEIIIPDADPEEVSRLKRQITRIGSLEFAILANFQEHGDTIRRARGKERDLVNDDGQVIASWRDVGEGKTVSRHGNVETRNITRDGKEVEQFLVILDPNPSRRITGQYLTRAYPTTDPNGGLAVGFTFNQRGGSLFYSVTSRHQPSPGRPQFRLAILLDNKVVSAPNLNTPIRNNGIIQGQFTRAEIDELIAVLNAGALEVPLQENPESEFSISPQLGYDVQQKGKWAIAIAGSIVLVFMIFYYLYAGVIADLCLILNIVLVMGAMALFEATFTLPGLAGIVLTIGMAVDANVLIFERIREEQNRGASLRMAIQNGFGRAFTTIVDANVTTLITAAILYIIGTDQIRGFAVTLFIGIVMSMFAALFFGRLCFDILERKRLIREVKMLHLFNFRSINFVSKQLIAVVFSVVLIVAGISSLVIRGEDNLDIDFTGGTMLSFEFEEEQDIDEIRTLLREKIDSSITLERLVLGDEEDTLDADKGKRFRLRTKEQDLDVVRRQVNVALGETGHDLLIIELTEYKSESIPEAGGDEDDTDEDADDEEPLLSDNEQRFAGGHKVAMSFSDPISTAAVKDNFALEVERITVGGSDDAPAVSKYSEPQELIEAVGVGEATTEGEAGDTAPEKFTELELFIGPEIAEDDMKTALGHLQTTMAENPIFDEVNRFESSVAGEMQRSALMAIFFSLVAVVGYIWFRFQRVTFGLAAVAALVHDVMVVLGMVALCSFLAETPIGPILMLEDFKINLPMIAAFLTIVGYSLNDTIVVFDRIREVRGKDPSLTSDMVNRSLNQTLSRTILTSLTTLIVVAILYIRGGEGIHGFAFCLVVGVIVGTYSSIYVASPVLLWLMGSPERVPQTASASPTT